MEREMHSKASNLIKPYCHFHNIVYSANRIIKCIYFKLPLFPNFPLVDLQRLKNNDRWLSDTHLTLALLWVPSSFRNWNYLNKSVIVFRIAPNERFGVTMKSNYWIRHFGKGYMLILIYTRMVSEEKTTYWNVILPSCQCLGCEEVVFCQLKYWIIILYLGTIGGLQL
jgi:hypothetical protein